MKLAPLFVSLSCLVLPLAVGQPLLQVLEIRGFTEYAASLRASPALLARLEGRNDLAVWAVPNGHQRLVRRQDDATISDSISHYGKPPTAAKRKRQAGTNPASNFQTLRTFLEDPAFVNLGPGQPARIVSSYTDPRPGSDQANIQISSGLGAVVNQIAGPFKFDNGMIYAVANFFTLPRGLVETLRTLNLDTFLDAITAAGKVKKLSSKPGVTILAPVNGSIHDDMHIDVNAHVITSGFFFLPELFDESPLRSDAGQTLTVTLKAGIFYVNGVRIIKSDVRTTNGVVHIIEKPLKYSHYSKLDVDIKHKSKPKSKHGGEEEAVGHRFKPRDARK